MAQLKKKMARKAVKTTAKHTAHGAASKLRRHPVRAVTLLAAGALTGLLIGWLLGRSGGEPSSPSQAPTPSTA